MDNPVQKWLLAVLERMLGVRITTPSWCIMQECGLEPLQFNSIELKSTSEPPNSCSPAGQYYQYCINRQEQSQLGLSCPHHGYKCTVSSKKHVKKPKHAISTRC